MQNFRHWHVCRTSKEACTRSGCGEIVSFAHGFGEMDVDIQQVRLCPNDIPGAELSKPYQAHTMSALRWWLLCRGIKVPTSWKKQKVIDRYSRLSIILFLKSTAACILLYGACRVNQAECEGASVVDVDGSYLYRKYRSVVESGQTVAQLAPPSPPLAGWKTVTADTCQSISPFIPVLTSGSL